MENDTLVMMVVMPVMFLTIGWVVWLIFDAAKVRHKRSLHNKLIDKFNNPTELSEFLKSEGGERFINSLTFNGGSSKSKILSSISKGIIFTFVGIALLFVADYFGSEAFAFKAFGFVTIAVGLGFVVSTFVSYYMGVRWGIIDPSQKD